MYSPTARLGIYNSSWRIQILFTSKTIGAIVQCMTFMWFLMTFWNTAIWLREQFFIPAESAQPRNRLKCARPSPAFVGGSGHETSLLPPSLPGGQKSQRKEKAWNQSWAVGRGGLSHCYSHSDCMCVFRLSVWHMQEYESAERCVDRVLLMEPNNYQAKQLKELVVKKLRRGIHIWASISRAKCIVFIAPQVLNNSVRLHSSSNKHIDFFATYMKLKCVAYQALLRNTERKEGNFPHPPTCIMNW